MKRKLKDGTTGSKTWWNIIKEKQGAARDSFIPPISTPEGAQLLTSSAKAERFAEFFSQKMKVQNPNKSLPTLPVMTSTRLEWVSVTTSMVKTKLLELDHKKATGPDNLNPLLLKKCANELALPIAKIFQQCIKQSHWPEQ